MIVCVCNAISERKVDAAIAAGARSVGCIFRHHEVSPRCGRCLMAMQERLGTPSTCLDAHLSMDCTAAQTGMGDALDTAYPLAAE